MLDVLQRNWTGLLLVVVMLVMHLGVHRHGAGASHRRHGGMGCGGHAMRSGPRHDDRHETQDGREAGLSPVTDPSSTHANPADRQTRNM